MTWLIKYWLSHIIFHFKLNNFSTTPKKLNAIFRKINYLAGFDYFFPRKHGSLALPIYIFNMIHQNMNSLHIFEMQPRRLKPIKMLIVGLHKIAISTKTKFFGRF